MINLEYFTKNRLFIISSILWAVIILLLVVFNTHRATGYKESIKTITSQRDSLENVINVRSEQISALTAVIEAKEMRLDTIESVNITLKNKLSKYEKNFIDISNMSTDDNIVFLTKQLSEKDNSR